MNCWVLLFFGANAKNLALRVGLVQTKQCHYLIKKEKGSRHDITEGKCLFDIKQQSLTFIAKHEISLQCAEKSGTSSDYFG